MWRFTPGLIPKQLRTDTRIMQARRSLVLMGLTLWCTLSTGAADGQPPLHQRAASPHDCPLHPFLTGREEQLKEDHHQPLKAINPGAVDACGRQPRRLQPAVG